MSIIKRASKVMSYLFYTMSYVMVACLLFSCSQNTKALHTKQLGNDIPENMKVNTQEALSDEAILSLDESLKALLSNNKALGAALLIRKGEQELYYGDVGYKDRESLQTWSRDTLVNIYSMTKPVTGITLMTLFEEGLFQLDDPVEQYLPEFTGMQVYKGMTDQGEPILEPAIRKVTILDLMRHTAGLGYGYEGNYPADVMKRLNPLDSSKPLTQMSQEIASVPLFFQPGKQWQYSTAVDIQARLAEALAGIPYEQLVHERVLTPLKMSNTAYYINNDEKERLSAVYIKNENGDFVREADELVYGFYKTAPIQTSGGSGLISTIDDYMRFAQMLQNQGSVGSVQIVKPETIALMTQDHLPDDIGDKSWLPGKGQMGFGIDFAVRIASPIDKNEPYGEPGEFFWDGRATTLFWVDPVNDVTVVFFTQVVPFDLSIHADIRKAVYKALDLYSFDLLDN